MRRTGIKVPNQLQETSIYDLHLAHQRIVPIWGVEDVIAVRQDLSQNNQGRRFSPAKKLLSFGLNNLIQYTSDDLYPKG